MPIPSIVAFDLGKVLVDFDYTIAARKIAARSTTPLPDLAFYLSHSPILVRYETGQVTRQQFFEEVRKATGFCGTIEEFGESFANIFTPIPPMVQLHAALRQKQIPTCIFSNTNDLAAEHIRRSFPFFSDFDGYIYSYKVGAMKPDAKIYEALERLVGRRGGDILYVDDRAENIAAGAARGWQVILQESPDKTRAVFFSLGLLNDH
jgi:HAD superfamily hydrolase (TIGR01509 family)